MQGRGRGRVEGVCRDSGRLGSLGCGVGVCGWDGMVVVVC